MKYIFLFFIIFIFSFTNSSAQQNHFLYFQTEAKQPFYIKLDSKTYTSSSSGYLIIPKLKHEKYKIIVGFPKNEPSELTINYTLEKDAGFLIKNFPEKGWGLFDLQSSNIIMPGEQVPANTASNEPVKSEPETKKDNFSEMLATVVNDSTIKEKDVVVKKTEKKENITIKEEPEQVQPVENSDTIVANPDTATQVLYTVITKNLQKKSRDGMEMIYTDEYSNNKDTIRVFMPSVRNIKKQEEASQVMDVTDTSKIIKQQSIFDQPFANSVKDSTVSMPENEKIITHDKDEASEKVNKEDNVKEQETVKEDKIEFLPAKPGMPNSNCKQYATEDDFFKLRKKMAAEDNNDDMIKVAKKAFKSKCFTTKDIKNLSALFLNDEGRYNFFDAAYAYVSDSDVFNTLQDQLTDTYYLNRFKAMIHQ